MTHETLKPSHSSESGPIARDSPTESKAEERARKRAEALRDNLKKRKAQANLRVSQTEPNGEET